MTSPLTPEAVAQIIGKLRQVGRYAIGGNTANTAADLIEAALAENLTLAADRDGWRQAVGKIAAAVPLPRVIAVTGTLGDMIKYFTDLVASEAILAAENATLRQELAQVREAIAVKGGTEHAPTEWAYLKACETIRGRDETIATLRASEAAARERIAAQDAKIFALTEALRYHNGFDSSDGWIALTTPTADKEPKT